MQIDNTLLDRLTAQAKESPRLRMNLDLRNSDADSSQRMLNALEPGTVLPIHRHCSTSETVAILRGCAVQWLYDADGNVAEKVLLEVGGAIPAMSVEKGQWHRLECLESGTVILEMKEGRINRLARRIFCRCSFAGLVVRVVTMQMGYYERLVV